MPEGNWRTYETELCMGIKSYNYIPNKLLFCSVSEAIIGKEDKVFTTSPDLYMGVEIEVDTLDDDFSILRNEVVGWLNEFIKEEASALGHYPLFYIKHDGSLRAGFEIVSMPGTLEYHLISLKQFYQGLFQI